jgi:hypothetical protein
MKFWLAWSNQQDCTKLKPIRVWFKTDHNSKITSSWTRSSRSFPTFLSRVRSRRSNQSKEGYLGSFQLLELSRNILARNGLYFEWIIHKGSNKDIHSVFMSLNILLRPFVSIISVIYLVNSRCILGYEQNKHDNFITNLLCC